MKEPQTIKTFLKLLLMTSGIAVGCLKGIEDLSEDEYQVLVTIVADIQNSLGEIHDILAKYNLKYKG